MIIWGSAGREIEKATGNFHCPQCDSPQYYQQFRVSTYFTLYFIPLFETQHHGDYVKCNGCHGQFKPEVVHYQPPTPAARALYAIRMDLENGTPIQMARTKLLNADLAEDVADQAIAAATGDRHVHCQSCRLSFIDSVARCSGCGANLHSIDRRLT